MPIDSTAIPCYEGEIPFVLAAVLLVAMQPIEAVSITIFSDDNIFKTLPPGAFTAILVGQPPGTGIGLIEIYNLK